MFYPDISLTPLPIFFPWMAPLPPSPPLVPPLPPGPLRQYLEQVLLRDELYEYEMGVSSSLNEYPLNKMMKLLWRGAVVFEPDEHGNHWAFATTTLETSGEYED